MTQCYAIAARQVVARASRTTRHIRGLDLIRGVLYGFPKNPQAPGAHGACLRRGSVASDFSAIPFRERVGAREAAATGRSRQIERENR